MRELQPITGLVAEVGAYVLHTDLLGCSRSLGDGSKSPSSLQIAAALSSNRIKIYDGNNLQLNSEVPQQSSNICSLRASPSHPSLLYSAVAGENGYVFLWDVRGPNNSPAQVLSKPCGDEVTSIAVGADRSGPDLLAVGYASGGIQILDTRWSGGSSTKKLTKNVSSLQKLWQTADCHSDAVTDMDFRKANRNWLLTSSEDGLLCVVDISAPSDSDEVLLTAINTCCSVRHMGYCAIPHGDGIYCCSGIETLSLWNHGTGHQMADLGRVKDIRSDVDFSIGGFDADADRGPFRFVLGNYEGRVVLATTTPQGRLVPDTVFLNGHIEPVRTFSVDTSLGIMVTGGEDGRIYLWDGTTPCWGMVTNKRKAHDDMYAVKKRR